MIIDEDLAVVLMLIAATISSIMFSIAVTEDIRTRNIHTWIIASAPMIIIMASGIMRKKKKE